jgi:hypothetical protein
MMRDGRINLFLWKVAMGCVTTQQFWDHNSNCSRRTVWHGDDNVSATAAAAVMRGYIRCSDDGVVVLTDNGRRFL